MCIIFRLADVCVGSVLFDLHLRRQAGRHYPAEIANPLTTPLSLRWRGEQLTKEQLNYQHQTQGNPYNQQMGAVEVKQGTVVAVQSVFCGKPGTPRLYCNPDLIKAAINMARFNKGR